MSERSPHPDACGRRAAQGRTHAEASRSKAWLVRAHPRARGRRPSTRRPSPRTFAAGAARRAAVPGNRFVIVARSVPEPFTQRRDLATPGRSRSPSPRCFLPDVRERPVGPEQVRAISQRLERRPARRRPRPTDSPAPESPAARTGLAHEIFSSPRQRRGRRTARVLPASRRRLRARRRRRERRTHHLACLGDLPISPSAIACTSRLPTSVASSGPASTGSPAARRPAAEQRVPSAAADDVHLARRDAGHLAEHLDRLARASGPGSRGCSARPRPARRGSACPSRRRSRGCAPACRPARRSAGRSGRSSEPSGGASLGQRDELVERVARARRAPTCAGTRAAARAR